MERVGVNLPFPFHINLIASRRNLFWELIWARSDVKAFSLELSLQYTGIVLDY